MLLLRDNARAHPMLESLVQALSRGRDVPAPKSDGSGTGMAGAANGVHLSCISAYSIVGASVLRLGAIMLKTQNMIANTI